MTRWFRITRLAVHVLRGLLISTLFFPFQSRAQREREIRRWSQSVLKIAAVRLHVHGAVSGARPLMLVGNHMSWLDIFAIQSVQPVRFVAKSETRAWPFAGLLSEKVGTLFIDQSRRRDTQRINVLVAEALRDGVVFAIFPEGTTTDGSRVVKFHASLLAPALDVGALVQPVAIRYQREDGTLCTEVAFDAVRSLWDTVLGLASQRSIDLHVSFLQPVASAERHRRDVAEDAREAILRTLFPAEPSSRSDTAADRKAAAR